MTVKITLFPTRSYSESVVLGDQGYTNDASIFYPLEAQHYSSDVNFNNGKMNYAYPANRLVVTHDVQTFDNEASWSANIKQQMAILAAKSIIIVAKTAIDKGPGTGDSIATAGVYAELVDAGAAFALADVGRTITITGAPTPANNGVFEIIEYVSATNIRYNNINRVAEAAPALSWTITGWEAQTPAQIRAL